MLPSIPGIIRKKQLPSNGVTTASGKNTQVHIVHSKNHSFEIETWIIRRK